MIKNFIDKEVAIALGKSKFWEKMSYAERATYQLFTDKLCMPFDIFHEALQKTLLRPVYTHEFGLNYEGLQKELLGLKEAPTFEEIVNLIPEEKGILILYSDE